MALRMKFLEENPNSDNSIRYPVSYAEAILVRENENDYVNVQQVIDDFVTKFKKQEDEISIEINYDSIENGAISGTKITSGTIDTDQIADDAITDIKIFDGAIIEDKIADDAVTTDKIVDGAVTLEKATFGQIEFLGYSNSTTFVPIESTVNNYRILILGVRGPGGVLLATTMFPLVQYTAEEHKISNFSTRHTENGEFDTYNNTIHNFVFAAEGKLETDEQGKISCSIRCANTAYDTTAILWGIK